MGRSTGQIVFCALLFAALTACTPEVGSERWCDGLRDKPKLEWTAEEVKGFTLYCIARDP